MKRARPIIAIDGPVGAGKSTVARALAHALDFTYVNTGAMYRAVAIAAREANVKPDGAGVDAALEKLFAAIVIKFEGERVILNGRDITSILGEPEIGELASQFSARAIVRERMRGVQRAAGDAGGVVMEGRDIGSVIFPGAEFKFFLDAAVEVRARRRFEELASKGVKAGFGEVLEQLKQRDERDLKRALAPLRRAPDAVTIDSTGLGVDQVVMLMKARILAGPA
ncbi:MAG: (d)CMP kinase [Candidatus Binataceae bacterium]